MLRRVRRLLSAGSSSSSAEIIESEVRDLEVLLEKYYNGTVQILSEEIAQVTVPAASPYRLELKSKLKLKNGKTEKVDLFVKLFDQDDQVDIRVDLLVRFKKEIEAYTTTIPALTEFQRDYGVIEEKLYDKLFPKCIATRLSMLDDSKHIPDNTAAIVLENLRVQGYQLEDISTGFDFETTKIVVENLARFHAVPLAMRLTNLDIFREKVIPSMVELKEYQRKADYYKLIDEFIHYGISGHEELVQYKEAIDSAIEYSKFNSWFRKSYSDQTWLTMCHSRYWILNIMVKRNEKRHPVASKIVDLQKFEYQNCCTDLTFFMFTSVEKETLEKKFDEILCAYFRAFAHTLEVYEILESRAIFAEAYDYGNFFEEFNLQGPKIVVEILENLRYVMCDGYDIDGEPIIGQKYKIKVRDTLLLMIDRGWMD